MPPRVEYALTDKGRALVPLIEDMRAFGSRWLDAGEDCMPELDAPSAALPADAPPPPALARA